MQRKTLTGCLRDCDSGRSDSGRNDRGSNESGSSDSGSSDSGSNDAGSSGSGSNDSGSSYDYGSNDSGSSEDFMFFLPTNQNHYRIITTKIFTKSLLPESTESLNRNYQNK